MKTFWKTQIAASILAAIAGISMQIVSHHSTADAAITGGLWGIYGYLIVTAFYSMSAIAHAPVELDEKRRMEIISAISAAADQLSKKDKDVQKLQNTTAELAEALNRKHPHDEHLEQQTKIALDKLDEQERQLVRWVLDAGTPNLADLAGARFHHDAPRRIVQKTQPFSLIKIDIIRTNNETVEVTRRYSIPRNIEPALRNILHPPHRPVTSR